MNIYIGNNKKDSKRISIKDLLLLNLAQSKDLNKNFIKISEGKFGDDSASWITIDKTFEKQKKMMTIQISLSGDGNQVEDINVYDTEIVTRLDEENAKKLC